MGVADGCSLPGTCVTSLYLVPVEYYRLVDPGSFQGGHRRVLSRGGNDGKRSNGYITRLAKWSIDRSVEVTFDVFFFNFYIIAVVL